MKKILFYGVSEKALEVFRQIGEAMEIDIVTYGDESLDRTVRDLFAGSQEGTGPCQAFADPYMIMQEISRAELIAFLQVTGTKGFRFDGIKAARTEHNEGWTLRQLMTQTHHERDLYVKMTGLKQMLAACGSIDLNSVEEPQRSQFKQDLINTYMLLQQPDLSEEQLDAAGARLSEDLRASKRILN